MSYVDAIFTSEHYGTSDHFGAERGTHTQPERGSGSYPSLPTEWVGWNEYKPTRRKVGSKQAHRVTHYSVSVHGLADSISVRWFLTEGISCGD